MSEQKPINGASMFIKPIGTTEEFINRLRNDKYSVTDYLKFVFSPYQIGDEVYFDDYKANIKDIKVVRVQELNIDEKEKISSFSSKVYSKKNNNRAFHLDFKDWYNKQYKNYEDNPYLFLYELGKKVA